MPSSSSTTSSSILSMSPSTAVTELSASNDAASHLVASTAKPGHRPASSVFTKPKLAIGHAPLQSQRSSKNTASGRQPMLTVMPLSLVHGTILFSSGRTRECLGGHAVPRAFCSDSAHALCCRTPARRASAVVGCELSAEPLVRYARTAASSTPKDQLLLGSVLGSALTLGKRPLLGERPRLGKAPS